MQTSYQTSTVCLILLYILLPTSFRDYEKKLENKSKVEDILRFHEKLHWQGEKQT